MCLFLCRSKSRAGTFFPSPLRQPLPPPPSPFRARDLVRQRHLRTPPPLLFRDKLTVTVILSLSLSLFRVPQIKYNVIAICLYRW